MQCFNFDFTEKRYMTVWIKKYKTGKVRLGGKEQASMPLVNVNVAIIEHN